MTETQELVSDYTIKYLKEIASEWARQAGTGEGHSLGEAMQVVDERRSTTAQPSSSPPKTG